jgi:hypothetical protein
MHEIYGGELGVLPRVRAMRKTTILALSLLVLEITSVLILATQQRYIEGNPSLSHLTWARTSGGDFRDYAYDASIVSGSIFVTGDTYDGKFGPVNLFILKYSSEGSLVWTATYPQERPIQISEASPNHSNRGNVLVSATTINSVNSMGRGIASDGVSLYVCGISMAANSTYYSLLLKCDQEGKIIWARDWRLGNDAKSTDVAVDRSGYIYVTGYVVLSADVNQEFLLKYDKEGNLLFSKIFESEYTEIAWGISLNDGVYICGETGCNATKKEGSGYKTHNMLVKKMDFNGNIIWTETYSSGYNNAANSIEAGKDVTIAGSTTFENGTIKAVLLKFSPEGILKYSKVFGESTAEDVPWKIVAAGYYTYLAGQTCPYPGHAPDAFLCKLSSDGMVKWWVWNWGIIEDRALSVAVSDDDVYIVGETYQSEVDSQVFVRKYYSSNVFLNPEVSRFLKLAPLIFGGFFIVVIISEVLLRLFRKSNVKVLNTSTSQ